MAEETAAAVVAPETPAPKVNFQSPDYKRQVAAQAPPAFVGPIVMHLLVPVAKAPAPHMVSGRLTSKEFRKFSEVTGHQAVGEAGRAMAPACNPLQVTNYKHRGSKTFHALLVVVNGEAVVSPIACQGCLDSKDWQQQLNAFVARNGVPHPKLIQRGTIQPDGCCGG